MIDLPSEGARDPRKPEQLSLLAEASGPVDGKSEDRARRRARKTKAAPPSDSDAENTKK